MTPLIVALGLILFFLLLILWKLFFTRAATQADSQQIEQLRMELSRLDGATRNQSQSVERQLGELRQTLTQSLQQVSETLDKKLLQIISESRSEREALNKVQLEAGAQLKADVNALLTTMSKALTDQLNATGNQLRATLHERLSEIQGDTARKLEEMRKTVDEKLHATLEQRLGEKFNLVSNQLEQVHRGLGEMQNLAAGVGDLKRVLTNVKARGKIGRAHV